MTQRATEVATAVPYSPEKEKFLVLKRNSNTEIHPDKWNFPGGHIEDEEAENAALRELREETSLTGKILKTGEAFKLDTEDGLFKIHPFLVLVADEPELNEEHVDKKWIEPRELDDLQTVDGLKRDLRKLDVEF